MASRNAAQEYPRLLSSAQAGLAGHSATELHYCNSELTHLNSKERENEATESSTYLVQLRRDIEHACIGLLTLNSVRMTESSWRWMHRSYLKAIKWTA